MVVLRNGRVRSLTFDRILANVLWCNKINKDKSAGKYERFEGSGDDRDPAFKMIL